MTKKLYFRVLIVYVIGMIINLAFDYYPMTVPWYKLPGGYIVAIMFFAWEWFSPRDKAST